MINFLLLCIGPLLFGFLSLKKRKGVILQRAVNIALCFIGAAVLYSLIWQVSFLTDVWQWVYSGFCSALALGLGLWLLKQQDRQQAFLKISAIVLIIVYAGRFFYNTMSAQEILAVRIAQSPFDMLLAESAAVVNPPLYFILLKGWITVFSDNGFGLTLFGFVFFGLLVGSAYWWFRQRKWPVLYLFLSMVLMLSISAGKTFFIWSYVPAALCCFNGVMLVLDQFGTLHPKKALLGILLLMMGCLFHYAAFLVCLPLAVVWLISAIRQHKVLWPLVFIACILLVGGLEGLLFLKSVIINTTPKDLEELQDGFSFFVSIFSGWKEMQFPYLFIVVELVAYFYLLFNSKISKALTAWIGLGFVVGAAATFAAPWIYSHFLYLWRNVELSNSAFYVMDVIIWLGFALLIGAAFSALGLQRAILVMSILVGTLSLSAMLRTELYYKQQTDRAMVFMNRLYDQGYSFVLSDHRGRIGEVDLNELLLFDWYGPQITPTLEYKGENLMDLNFDDQGYVILSTDKITDGLKQILKADDHAITPLGYVVLQNVQLYIYKTGLPA